MGRVKPKRSGEVLMLVEDPRKSIEALYPFIGGEVTLSVYKREYERVINRVSKPIHIKHAHTHFYTLSIYRIIEPSGRSGTFRVSETGLKLCALLKGGKYAEYRSLLAKVLLASESKSELFQKFLKFVSDSKTFKQVYDRFGNITGRTLIAWTCEADLAISDNAKVRAIPRDLPKPSPGKFWTTVTDAYREFEKSETLGITRMFMPISELRFTAGVELGLTPDDFDDLLREALDSSIGGKASLYGATSEVYASFRPLVYNKKAYAYISIGV